MSFVSDEVKDQVNVSNETRANSGKPGTSKIEHIGHKREEIYIAEISALPGPSQKFQAEERRGKQHSKS
jgi:hypothetical protein